MFYLVCNDGFFGRECFFVCLLNCKMCWNIDGYCGCFDGYIGYNCNIGIFLNKIVYLKKLWNIICIYFYLKMFYIYE